MNKWFGSVWFWIVLLIINVAMHEIQIERLLTRVATLEAHK